MTIHLPRRLLAWACVAAALLATVFALLYAHAQTFDEKDYFEDVVALRRIKELDARLDMDVVRSRMQRNMDYDSLAKALDEMSRLADETAEDAHTERYEQAQELARTRRALVQAVREKSGSVGRLKSSNLELQNARNAVLSAAEELQAHAGLQSPAARTMRARARKLTAATMLVAQADSGPSTASSLVDLSRLEQDATELPPAQRQLVLEFSGRMRAFLREQRAGTEVLASITAAAVGPRADEVNNLLNWEQERFHADTQRLRNHLVALTSVLALLLVYFAAKLLLSHREIARVNDALKAANENLEQRVQQRTQELRATQEELVGTARRAGMAEIATNVLHNVGNILNSVNTSASLIRNKVRDSRVKGLGRVVDMMAAHAADLGDFLTLDEKGRLLPAYLGKLSQELVAEQQEIIAELAHLNESVEHIKNVVATQQSHAGGSVVTELLRMDGLVQEALRINDTTLTRLNVLVRSEFEDVPAAQLDKTRVMQILVNLIRNGAQAMEPVSDRPRLLTVRVEGDDAGVRVCVKDQGIGIAHENLTRIFSHGFTTRVAGHGFGLHSCAMAAVQMGGKLWASSEGPARGATFTLELPIGATKAA